MNKRILAMTAAVICFLLAVGIILYPAVSNYINEKYESVIQTSYEENIAQAEDTTLKEILENARSYNRAISPGAVSDDTYSRESLMTASQGYEKQLCVSMFICRSIMAQIRKPWKKGLVTYWDRLFRSVEIPPMRCSPAIAEWQAEPCLPTFSC